MPNHYPYMLQLRSLNVDVHLGVGDEERARKQRIVFDIRLYMSEAPKAAQSDEAAYLCYDALSQKITTLCEQKPYRLIEFLTMEVYRLLRKELDASIKIWLCLHKPNLPGTCLKDGASFTYSDLPADACLVPHA